MSDLKPVSRPPALLDGRGGWVVACIGIAVFIAFLKPWGSTGTAFLSPSAAVVPTSSPSAAPSTSTSPDPRDADSRRYDRLIFGDHELQAGWGLWPAGYMVSFGFAMHVEPSGRPGGASSASPAVPEPGSPTWPAAIDVPYGNHLLLIGVNTPEGFAISKVRLTRYLADGRGEDVPVVRPPSPWPSHFNVIGMDSGDGVERTALWTPGRYRLDLSIDPGSIAHSIEIMVDGPPAPIRSDPPASLVP